MEPKFFKRFKLYIMNNTNESFDSQTVMQKHVYLQKLLTKAVATKKSVDGNTLKPV